MRWLASLISLVVLAAAVGNGNGNGNGDASGNAPTGKTVIAKVYSDPRKGIPAEEGQWMVDIGVRPGSDLAFTVAKVIVPFGNTNFRLRNPQNVVHNLTVEEVGTGSVETPSVRKGSAWVRMSLFDDRRYVFYCSVPGHREAGMEGTIKVDLTLGEQDLKPF